MTRDLMHPARVAAMRFLQAVSPAGVAGCALIVSALATGAWMWRAQADGAALPPPPVGRAEVARPVLPPPVQLSGRHEVPLLLTQVQQVAVANGFAWPAADYKLKAATDSSLGALEIHARLRGRYPQWRASISQWLRQVPGLTVADLSLSRLTSDAADVDGEVTLVIWLDDAPPATAYTSKATP